MGLTFEPQALPGFLAAGLGFLLAAVVLFTRPDRSQNRRLALLLAITSSIPGTIYGLRLSATTASTLHPTMALFTVCVLAVPATYLLFLATLDTPLVRPFKGTTGTLGLILLGVVSVGAWFVRPEWFIEDVFVRANGEPAWAFGEGFLRAATLPEMAVLLFGAVVAISVYRRASSAPAKRQARWYAIAFVTRDILLPGYLLFDNFATLPEGFRSTYNPIVYPSIDIAFILLLGYGILQTQLFAIDLRIKQTVEHGTVAAVLIGAYSTASVLGEIYVGGTAGTVLGVGATGLLVLGIVPLQGLGSRLADAAMPEVHDTPAYLEGRKLEVYKAALEEGMGPDGELDEREERLLARMRERLGLSERDHVVLLHALTAGGARSGATRMEAGVRVLGRYRLKRRLGRGGQGTTWFTRDEQERRAVVLKVFHTGGATDAVLREAEAMAAVEHPALVTLHDVQAIEGRVVLVMEHVDGGSLAERLEDGPLEPSAVERLAEDLLGALSALHGAGILHRDVNPSNVLVATDGTFKLADLGVARLPETDETAHGLAGNDEPVGTARYMSPEQAQGQHADERTDLFSAAATVHEAATGSPLFEPRDNESAIGARMRVAAWEGFTRELEGQPAWRSWFTRALARSPDDRFQSADEMLDAIPGPPA